MHKVVEVKGRRTILRVARLGSHVTSLVHGRVGARHRIVGAPSRGLRGLLTMLASHAIVELLFHEIHSRYNRWWDVRNVVSDILRRPQPIRRRMLYEVRLSEVGVDKGRLEH